MAESRTSLSKSGSLQELAEFWDTHDLTDFEDQIYEVHFEVDIRSRKHYVAIDPDLITEVRRVARSRGLSTESLVNLWLQQQLQAAKAT
mgnify:CR=1 FL=1